ncbi:GvpL/GvpF family gas vesicle protein [Streptomyces sp. NPDC004726]
MSVYVYSITADDHPLRVEGATGVGDPPGRLRTVTAEGLAAIVSDAPEDLRPKRRDLAAHQEVQDLLMADGAVLPLRFGLTAPDDTAVRDVLEDRSDVYLERLHALADSAEYHLKAGWDQDALLRDVLASSAEARQLNDAIRSGTAAPDMPLALGELVSGEVERLHRELADRVLETLRPFTEDEVVSTPGKDDFLSVSFLVGSGDEEEFRTAQENLARRLERDVTMRLRGPLPPYSFVGV